MARPGLKPVPPRGKPANNRLSYGAASRVPLQATVTYLIRAQENRTVLWMYLASTGTRANDAVNITHTCYVTAECAIRVGRHLPWNGVQCDCKLLLGFPWPIIFKPDITK
jgi:hypothetical protein